LCNCNQKTAFLPPTQRCTAFSWCLPACASTAAAAAAAAAARVEEAAMFHTRLFFKTFSFHSVGVIQKYLIVIHDSS
jgi:hypothetical protein